MSMMSDYKKLFEAYLKQVERPLPKNCAQRGWPQSRECKLAGGCPICYAEILSSGRRKKKVAMERKDRTDIW